MPDSKRSPAWLTTARTAASSAASPGRAAPKASATPVPNAAALIIPPIRPAQVFFGLMRGANFGPPNGSSGGIGADIGRPDGEQQVDQKPETVLCDAAHPQQGDAAEDDVRDAESKKPAMLSMSDSGGGEQSYREHGGQSQRYFDTARQNPPPEPRRRRLWPPKRSEATAPARPAAPTPQRRAGRTTASGAGRSSPRNIPPAGQGVREPAPRGTGCGDPRTYRVPTAP